MQTALPSVAVDPLAGSGLARQFAQQHPAAILVHDFAEPGQQTRRIGVRHVVNVALEAERLGR
jgi:hypothetical protein